MKRWRRWRQIFIVFIAFTSSLLRFMVAKPPWGSTPLSGSPKRKAPGASGTEPQTLSSGGDSPEKARKRLEKSRTCRHPWGGSLKHPHCQGDSLGHGEVGIALWGKAWNTSVSEIVGIPKQPQPWPKQSKGPPPKLIRNVFSRSSRTAAASKNSPKFWKPQLHTTKIPAETRAPVASKTNLVSQSRTLQRHVLDVSRIIYEWLHRFPGDGTYFSVLTQVPRGNSY